MTWNENAANQAAMAADVSNILLKGRARDVYRRDHAKADGRALRVYGYDPHTGAPGEELLAARSDQSELRRDPLRGTVSLYAPHRQARTFNPSAAQDPLAPAGGAVTEIPFTDFELAIFDNRFPGLKPGVPAGALTDWADGAATGRCEVVVYTSAPEGSLDTIGQDRRVLLLEALIDRYRALHADGAAYVMPFENRGEQVGVTLPHPHGQIYSFPFVPAPQAAAAKAFAGGYDLTADHARWGGRFDIASAGDVSAFCPPFSRFPYETWIMPRQRRAGPWAMAAEEIEALAELLGDLPRRLDALFGAPMPYMMSLQAAPGGAAKDFQFTVQFYPILRDAGRLKFLAGVEQFTGVFTVDVVPEAAAERLRAL
jgi:UDPglucose--hexose-1-phosphate uridylyltransferase